MRFAFYAFLLCASLSQPLCAKAQIRGRVTDAGNGEDVANATIRLADGRQTVADEEGRFLFRVPAVNGIQVTVSAVGYAALDTFWSSGSFLAVRLQKMNRLMQPIELRAVRAGTASPFTQSTIGAEEIAKTNLGRDIPFALDQTPSVVVHADAGNGVGYTGIRIRGTDATRINMTLNGIPYNDAESQGIFFVNLPDFLSSAGSIQVQRGVGTSSNGTGAFGATLNISTNEVQEKPYAEVSNSYGSFDTWKHTAKAGTGLLDGRFTMDARLSRIQSNGFIDRASSDLQSFFLSTAWLKPDASLRLNIFSGKEKTYQAWYGIPESKLQDHRTYNPAGTEKAGEPYDNETDNYRQTHAQLFYNRRFSQTLNLQTALFYTRGLGYYEQYKARRKFSSVGLPNPIVNGLAIQRTDLVRQLWLDNHYLGQTFSLQYKRDRREVIGGGGGTRYLGDHYGKIVWAQYPVPIGYRWYEHDATKDDLNLFVKWQEQLGRRFFLFADLQYRSVGYRIEGFRDNPQLKVDDRWGFLNPKLGISWLGNGYKAYASYAKGSKEPNRDDFEAGAQQRPSAEHLHDLEAGYERSSAKASWGFTAYYMRYRDQLVLTGRINDVGAYTRTNIPESFRAGIELTGKWKATQKLELKGNATWSKNQILGLTVYYDDYDQGGQKNEAFERSPIAFSPALTAAASATWQPLKNLSVALPAKFVSRQYLDNTGRRERSLDPFFTQDLLLSWRPACKLAKETLLTLMLNNVFDAAYEPNGYSFSYYAGNALVTENGYFPMAGRQWMAGITLRW
ncbi:MAG: TonB-dependent receptor [Bacteroidetes bacterium]|nr:TonB-dependent receptor [Bacteroidota bacterium]